MATALEIAERETNTGIPNRGSSVQLFDFKRYFVTKRIKIPVYRCVHFDSAREEIGE